MEAHTGMFFFCFWVRVGVWVTVMVGTTEPHKSSTFTFLTYLWVRVGVWVGVTTAAACVLQVCHQ